MADGPREELLIRRELAEEPTPQRELELRRRLKRFGPPPPIAGDPDAPQPVKQITVRRTPLERLTDPETLQAAGGMAGGLIAGAATRTPGGARGGQVAGQALVRELTRGAVGGVLGGAAGRASGEAVDIATGDKAPGAFELLPGIRDAATFEAGTETAMRGGLRVGSLLFRGAGLVTGVMSREAQNAIARAREAGFELSPADLNLPFFRGMAKVGGVIPVVGGPIRRLAGRRALETSEKTKDILDSIAPPIDLPRLGAKLSTRARETLDARQGLAQRLYGNMWEIAEPIRDLRLFPTERLKAAAQEELGNVGNLPRTAKGEPIGVTPFSERFRAELNRFLEAPEFMTPRELRELMKNLNKASRSRSGKEANAAEFGAIERLQGTLSDSADQLEATITRATPEDLLRMGVKDAGQFFAARDDGLKFVQAMRQANKAWQEFKGLRDTAAAKAFQNIDRNFFKAGFVQPGTKEFDELADMLLGGQSLVRSPEFILNLEKLIGVEGRKLLGRAVVLKGLNPGEGAVPLRRAEGEPRAQIGPVGIGTRPVGNLREGETDVIAFDAAGAKRLLGLTSPEGVGGFDTRKSVSALDALLAGTGISSKTLKNFLDVVERQQRVKVLDPSAFLARRVILSGSLQPPRLGGAGAAVAGAGAATAGLIDVGTLLIGGNLLNRAITSPAGLRVLTQGLKIKPNRQAQVLWATRLVRAVANSGETIRVQLPDGTERDIKKE